MSNLQFIFKLTAFTVLLAVGLLAFTLISRQTFERPELLGCGTVAMSDVVSEKKYSIPLDHPGQKLFQSNCKACHRLDQKLVGPPLRNSFESSDSVWFVSMIIDANKLIDSGDPLAVALFNEYNQTRHTTFEGFSKEELTNLVEYLKLEGQRDNGE